MKFGSSPGANDDQCNLLTKVIAFPCHMHTTVQITPNLQQEKCQNF